MVEVGAAGGKIVDVPKRHLRGNSRIFSARLNLVWGGEEKEETVFIKLWSSIHAVL